MDSVELLMDIEDYFQVAIPNQEAESIYTIQNMVDTVAKQLQITAEEKTLQQALLEKIKNYILSKHSNHIQIGDKIIDHMPLEKQNFLSLSAFLNMTVPYPDYTNNQSKKLSEKIKRFINWKPLYNAEALTFEHMADAILSSNYTTVIDPKNINNKYEIYIAVCALTENKIGVDYYELNPEKSFTTDLGLD